MATDDRLSLPAHRLNESRLWIAVKNLSEKDRQEFLTMTWEEVFELACLDEQTRKTLPPHDVAYLHFANGEHQMLKLAELLQIREQYQHLLLPQTEVAT